MARLGRRERTADARGVVLEEEGRAVVAEGEEDEVVVGSGHGGNREKIAHKKCMF